MTRVPMILHTWYRHSTHIAFERVHACVHELSSDEQARSVAYTNLTILINTDETAERWVIPSVKIKLFVYKEGIELPIYANGEDYANLNLAFHFNGLKINVDQLNSNNNNN
ncbi:hypothetical protein TNCV_1329631 [Trichonephila clavipes]|nr:hypothetical protein TNCV_1329631 [Trichonephila clavipes]